LRPETLHRFANTTDVIATIEEILGLEPLSQFDNYGRPLREIFEKDAQLTPYEPIVPQTSLDEKNPENGPAAKQSMLLDLTSPDASDDDLFNRILWQVIKGDALPIPIRGGSANPSAPRAVFSKSPRTPRFGPPNAGAS
jgi:hypothetical protein